MKFNKKHIQHGIVQCDPIPSQVALESYYREKYYQESKGSYDVTYTEEEIKHKIYEAELITQSISGFVDLANIGKYKFLELGCGEGFLLSQANKVGFDVLGVDHSEFGIKKWHPNLENNFIQTDLYKFLENEKNNGIYDFCVLKNVLEHVLDPAFLLKKIKKILKPEGKIIITIPNDYSKVQNKLLELEYVGEEAWFSPPDHIHYFNTTNFPLYVNDLGLKILDMYCSFPVDMFLFNKNSNYMLDRKKGKDAHFARIKIDLLIRDAGLQKSLDLYRAMAQCGIGRNFTTILTVV